MSKPKVKAKPKVPVIAKTWGASHEDLTLLAALQSELEKSMGTVTETAVIRMGLRSLAESRGLSLG